ncbi:craniofacial development protein 2-like protein [Plakobranchus ocellatus]|uniref:Craniofacial development protein 2-like protein n=1 Tax=Plakobranchus ocellatus TaxID=259542 RepID=A0AAV3Z897_9GAST|nr:craniofacial development protein 2-like protein [Plakobranchus ocellatus]
MGDFNAKVGEGREENIVGPHGLGTRNLRGEKLVEWCKMNNLIIGNTWFQQPPRRKWTWKSPGQEIRNHIDFILLTKKTNDTVLEEAHTTRLLISKIRKRQVTFFGHVMRREKLENLVTTGMLEGKRSRGKQREKLIEGLTDWLKAGKSLEAIEATKDRKMWWTMIANAVKQGT